MRLGVAHTVYLMVLLIPYPIIHYLPRYDEVPILLVIVPVLVYYLSFAGQTLSYLHSNTRQKLFLLTSCCNPLPLDSWLVLYKSHGGSRISGFALKDFQFIATWNTIDPPRRPREMKRIDWSAADDDDDDDDDDVYKTPNNRNKVLLSDVCSLSVWSTFHFCFRTASAKIR